MLPSGESRFCGSCAKHVVDFSGMSDHELTEYLRNRKHAACGRFRAEQLEKVYTERAQLKVPFPKRFARFVLSLFIGSVAEKASAQTDTLPVTPIDTIAKYVSIDSLQNDTAVADAETIPEKLEIRWEAPETPVFVAVPEEFKVTTIVLGSFMPEPQEEPNPIDFLQQFFRGYKKPIAEVAQGNEPPPEPLPAKENSVETAIMPVPTRFQKKKKA